RTDQKDDESKWLIEHVPVHSALLQRYFTKAQASGHHQQCNYRKTHRDLIRNHLRCGTHSTHQREFVIRRPATNHDTIDTHAQYAKNIQYRNINIGCLKDNIAAKKMKPVAPRNYRARHQSYAHRNGWAYNKQELVRRIG